MDSNNACKVHIKEAHHIAFLHGPNKDPRLTGSDITFSEKEACRLLYPHTNALIIILPVENTNLHIIIIDTRSSADILFSEAWKAMKLTHPLRLVIASLLGFFRFSMTLEGSITLPITIGQGIDMQKLIVDFLKVNYPSPYNEILEGPFLHASKAIA